MQYNETMAISGPVVAVGVALLAACSPYGGGEFACMDDGQCAASTPGGRCEADGRCSFPDDSCASGRRYGTLSGAASSRCVGEVTDDAGLDAPVDDVIVTDDAPDALVTPFCDAADPTLVACWQFEGTLDDASGEGNTGTSATATYATGKLGMGVVLQATTLISVADSLSLSPTRLTIEGWIRPTQLPAGTARMGILDNNNQYGFFLYANRVDCSATVTISAPVTVPTNTWTHVACTYDGTTGRVYIDGIERGTAAGGADLGTGDSSGTVIGGNSPSGDHLVGMIDQLRMWTVARTAAQICAASDAVCP